ncbi:MarR family transcriptional regulator [Paenibacillus spiritus]|uniref:MarR family transcriptional regulator n=1 Tax=Paenibacillus spiritus TaxID=2496557 RepID=A0A5J5GCI7_9BACL|nr:MarR family transcriptional regulator [Paenibacillus spiritus]KAA9005876.1 MarR family transcriptional regulator [Paenibacillus spiritus]
MSQPHDERLLQEVFEAFGQFAKKIHQEDDEEKAWLLAQVTDPQVHALLSEMTFMMVHVLDGIGKLGRANGSALSSRFEIPKGTVSKLTKRLQALGLIKFVTIPDNKKELYFELTAKGDLIYKLHEQFDERVQAGAARLLAKYTEEQLMFIRDFMNHVTSHSFLQHDKEPVQQPAASPILEEQPRNDT